MTIASPGPDARALAAHTRMVRRIAEIRDAMQASDGRGRWALRERIAGALLADEVAWLPDDCTLAEAIGRLDDTWLSALLDTGLGHIRQPVVRDDGAAREDLVARVMQVASAMLAADGDGDRPWRAVDRCAAALYCGIPALLPPGHDIVSAMECLQGDWLAAIVEADRRRQLGGGTAPGPVRGNRHGGQADGQVV